MYKKHISETGQKFLSSSQVSLFNGKKNNLPCTQGVLQQVEHETIRTLIPILYVPVMLLYFYLPEPVQYWGCIASRMCHLPHLPWAQTLLPCVNKDMDLVLFRIQLVYLQWSYLIGFQAFKGISVLAVKWLYWWSLTFLVLLFRGFLSFLNL